MIKVYNDLAAELASEGYELGFEYVHTHTGTVHKFWYSNSKVVKAVVANGFVREIKEFSGDLDTLAVFEGTLFDSLMPREWKEFEVETVASEFTRGFRALFGTQIDYPKVECILPKMHGWYEGPDKKLYCVTGITKDSVLLTYGECANWVKVSSRDFMRYKETNAPIELTTAFTKLLSSLHEIVNSDELADLLSIIGYTNIEKVRQVQSIDIHPTTVLISDYLPHQFLLAQHAPGINAVLQIGIDGVAAKFVENKSLRLNPTQSIKECVKPRDFLQFVKDTIDELVYSFVMAMPEDSGLVQYLTELSAALV